MTYTESRRLAVRRLALLTFGLFALTATIDAQSVSPPATSCHVTDGAFTTCPDGSIEWADTPANFFPDSRSYLYAVEADLSPTLGSAAVPHDTLMLMYDECGRTAPLGPNEYTLVNFSTVEIEGGEETLQRYSVTCLRTAGSSSSRTGTSIRTRAASSGRRRLKVSVDASDLARRRTASLRT